MRGKTRTIKLCEWWNSPEVKGFVQTDKRSVLSTESEENCPDCLAREGKRTRKGWRKDGVQKSKRESPLVETTTCPVANSNCKKRPH